MADRVNPLRAWSAGTAAAGVNCAPPWHVFSGDGSVGFEAGSARKVRGREVTILT